MRFVSCAVSHWKIAKRSRSSWAIIIRFFPLSQNPHVIRGQKFGGLTPHKRLRYFRKGFSDNFKQRSFYAKPRQSSGSWMHNETATFGHSFRSPCQNCSYASGGKLGFKHCQSTRNGGMYIQFFVKLFWFGFCCNLPNFFTFQVIYETGGAISRDLYIVLDNINHLMNVFNLFCDLFSTLFHYCWVRLMMMHPKN